MSDRLFPREWKIQVDTLDVSNLDCEFKILNTSKPQPNKCVLTIWDLNQDHRSQLFKRNRPAPDKIVGVPVQVVAGYKDNTSAWFSGDLREVAGQRDATDRKTTLSGDDGGRSYREARIDQSYKAGTPVGTILQQCCEAMGIGIGNAANFTATAEIEGLGATIPSTWVLSGSVAKELNRLTSSMGITWSIQRGALQLLKKGAALNLSAIRLTPDTGLLGSPQASIDATVSLGNPQQFVPGKPIKVPKPKKPKDPSVIKLRAMLIPGLFPGRKIVLESDEFNGGYVLTEVEPIGKTWAKDDWYCDCIARVY